MRATFIGLILALAAASSAADTLPFNGTLSLTTGNLLSNTAAPPVTVSTTGSGTGSSIGGGAASIPTNVFAINQGVVLPSDVIAGFAVCGSGIADNTVLNIPSATAACPTPLTNNSLSFDGAMGTGGLAGSAYFTGTAFITRGDIPLTVIGSGGSTTGVFLSGLFPFTVQGNPWTTAPVTSSGAFQTFGITTVLTAAGFDNRDASGQGTLQLVTPALIHWAGGGGYDGDSPIISVMTLDFVPEPGTVLLLGSGIAALVVLGRRRMSDK